LVMDEPWMKCVKLNERETFYQTQNNLLVVRWANAISLFVVCVVEWFKFRSPTATAVGKPTIFSTIFSLKCLNYIVLKQATSTGQCSRANVRSGYALRHYADKSCAIYDRCSRSPTPYHPKSLF